MKQARHKAFILTGSNLGDRQQFLDNARIRLCKRVGALLACSSIYESEALGFAGENFLNQVLLFKSVLSARQILEIALATETENGRVRNPDVVGYSSRSLDVDLLFYDSAVINEPDLTVPHPRLHLRRFTLLPLCEIAPDFEHPALHKTVAQLLATCEDNSSIKKCK